jgi:hypothetical protein
VSACLAAKNRENTDRRASSLVNVARRYAHYGSLNEGRRKRFISFTLLLDPYGENDVLGFGLSFGLIVGLNRGGSAVVKHYALRLVLWLSGNTPL